MDDIAAGATALERTYAAITANVTAAGPKGLRGPTRTDWTRRELGGARPVPI